MNTNQKIIKFWDTIFEKDLTFNPKDPIKITEIEDSLKFLAKQCPSIIDYGCGHGKMLFRCLSHGAKRLKGIDISQNAINTAQKIADTFGLNHHITLECGGIELLDNLENNTFSGAILFNILDNLTIKDGKTLIQEIHRIIKKDGYVLLKLNPYLSKTQCETLKLKEIDHDLYIDTHGLYLWNISDDLLKILINDLFTIEKSIMIHHHNINERLYYLRGF